MPACAHADIESNNKGTSKPTAVIEARRRGERTRATTLSSPAATKPAVGIAVDEGSICEVMGLSSPEARVDGIDLATRRGRGAASRKTQFPSPGTLALHCPRAASGSAL